MEPINKQDVLIRLLKDGHITNEEFKVLYEDNEPTEIVVDGLGNKYPLHDPFKPFPYQPDFNHLYDPNNGPFNTIN